MVTDLRKKKFCLPVIPSSSTIRSRICETRAQLKQLEILLKLACDLEEAAANNVSTDMSGAEKHSSDGGAS